MPLSGHEWSSVSTHVSVVSCETAPRLQSHRLRPLACAASDLCLRSACPLSLLRSLAFVELNAVRTSPLTSAPHYSVSSSDSACSALFLRLEARCSSEAAARQRIFFRQHVDDGRRAAPSTLGGTAPVPIPVGFSSRLASAARCDSQSLSSSPASHELQAAYSASPSVSPSAPATPPGCGLTPADAPGVSLYARLSLAPSQPFAVAASTYSTASASSWPWRSPSSLDVIPASCRGTAREEREAAGRREEGPRAEASRPHSTADMQGGEAHSGDSKRPAAQKSALASGVAAVVTCCVLHPLDLIKTRLQVSAITKGAIPRYSSSAQAIREIWKLEGTRGLWKGVTATAAASGISWITFRYLFDSGRYHLTSLPAFSSEGVATSRTPLPASSSSVSPLAVATSSSVSPAASRPPVDDVTRTRPADEPLLGKATSGDEQETSRIGVVVAPGTAGCSTQDQQRKHRDGQQQGGDTVAFRANLVASIVAGFLSTLLTHPLWLVKARMEMQAYETQAISGWPRYRGPLDCLLSLRRTGGLPALYAGLGPAIMLVPHAAVQIMVYEEMKKRAVQTPERERDSDSGGYGVRPFIWGAASKCAAITVTYPLQVLRARQQVANSPYAGKNSLQIAGLMLRSEGFLSLFGGYFVHLQRACLQNGIMFLLFEHLVGSLRSR
ncbi:hypothetical protein BESB_066290 [Besnoitia besnoiti]|uniref:Carrier superfamily protein n=1 Tax=Besnoitia besnoiti TaxID=94643 RepID=A0A2A9MF72_BESBE|nr:hypothetical protein BESB_066290 [Besnoitia besnoiti]PFH34596.1 hypothetical protein BESB_066290 [Besnoitia besnoiti]